MKYGFCALPVVPMRAEASDRSEMVSQLLFGDTFVVEEYSEKWTLIVVDFDGYRGWVDTKQLCFLSMEDCEKVKAWSAVQHELLTVVQVNNRGLLLPMGSRLPSAGDSIPNGISVEYMPNTVADQLDIQTIAQQWLGSPYLWGGKTCLGVDCSGFVQTLFKVAGYSMQRDASQQVLQGCGVDSISEALPNDLCFFKNDSGKIIHVGIYMGSNKIIHASGEVRIDTIDDKGIFNADRQAYTHTLSSIRRMR